MTRKSARLRKRGETSHPPKVGVGPTTNERLQFIGLLVETFLHEVAGIFVSAIWRNRSGLGAKSVSKTQRSCTMASVVMVVSGAKVWTMKNATPHPTGFWSEEFVTPHRK